MKIHEYNEMMSYLTRPAQPTVNRQNFYPGGSVEEFGQQIKDGYLEGKSTTKINEELFPGANKLSTIDSFIQSAKEGLAPIKITEKELANRPVIAGGQGQSRKALERLETFVEGFVEENGRPPSKKELLRLGGFDFYTVTKAVDSGAVNVLDPKLAYRMARQEDVNQQLLDLSKDKDINEIFKTGKTSSKDIKKVKKIIGNVTDSVAADRLLELASIYTGEDLQNRNLGIEPKFKNNAKKILDSSPYTGYIRNMYEAMIGKSVGEPSIKGLKQKITENPEYKKTNIAKLFSIDEPQGVTSSVKRGNTPYGIFGQIIDGSKNSIKVGWDRTKSNLELEVQKAINEFGVDSKEAKKAKDKYNTEATKVQNKLNEGRLRGGKKITIPKMSFDAPENTIANYKNFNNTYKKAFNDVYKNNKYSFVIPKDIKTIPELRKEVLDPNSSTYKKMINTLKKGFNEFDEKKLFQKLKNATPESIRKNLKLIPRIASVDDDFTGPGGYPLTAGLDSSIGTQPTEEEKTFAERNPLTTGAALTAPSAVAVQRAAGIPVLEALKNLGKVPFKTVMSVPGAGYFAYDTIKEGMDEGKSFLDAATEPEVGLELLYPEILKRTGATFLNPLTRASTPIGIGITTGGTLKNRAKEMMKQAEGITALPAGEAQNRLIEEYAAQNYRGYANGGRIGFADGPEDPSKRKTMKILGGLATLPLIGRFFDIAEKAAPLVEKIKTPYLPGKPEWFDKLVNRVIAEGEDVTKRFSTQDRQIVHKAKINETDEVTVYQNLDDGQIDVVYDSPTNMGEESVNMTFKPGMADETTGGKPPDEFRATEVEPQYVGGPEDADIEFIGEGGGSDVRMLESDLTPLKKFAGEKVTMKETLDSIKRNKSVEKINNDTMEQAEYIAGKYGDVPEPDIDDFID